MSGNRKWIVAAVAVLFLMAMVAIYGRSSAPSQIAAPAEAGTRASSSGKGTPSGGLVQSSKEGPVTIDLKWVDPGNPASDSLDFDVAMDTHSVDLDGIDLGKQAALRNDRGQEVQARSWNSRPGGHHRSGALSFPAKDGSGKPIVDSATKYVEITIRDVGDVKERVLRWRLEAKTS